MLLLTLLTLLAALLTTSYPLSLAIHTGRLTDRLRENRGGKIQRVERDLGERRLQFLVASEFVAQLFFDMAAMWRCSKQSSFNVVFTDCATSKSERKSAANPCAMVMRRRRTRRASQGRQVHKNEHSYRKTPEVSAANTTLLCYIGKDVVALFDGSYDKVALVNQTHKVEISTGREKFRRHPKKARIRIYVVYASDKVPRVELYCRISTIGVGTLILYV